MVGLVRLYEGQTLDKAWLAHHAKLGFPIYVVAPDQRAYGKPFTWVAKMPAVSEWIVLLYADRLLNNLPSIPECEALFHEAIMGIDFAGPFPEIKPMFLSPFTKLRVSEKGRLVGATGHVSTGFWGDPDWDGWSCDLVKNKALKGLSRRISKPFIPMTPSYSHVHWVVPEDKRITRPSVFRFRAGARTPNQIMDALKQLPRLKEGERAFVIIDCESISAALARRMALGNGHASHPKSTHANALSIDRATQEAFELDKSLYDFCANGRAGVRIEASAQDFRGTSFAESEALKPKKPNKRYLSDKPQSRVRILNKR